MTYEISEHTTHLFHEKICRSLHYTDPKCQFVQGNNRRINTYHHFLDVQRKVTKCSGFSIQNRSQINMMVKLKKLFPLSNFLDCKALSRTYTGRTTPQNVKVHWLFTKETPYQIKFDVACVFLHIVQSMIKSSSSLASSGRCRIMKSMFKGRRVARKQKRHDGFQKP